ncbi:MULTISPECIES: PAS domain-containing sensor histidine kinase [unclassified Campylobacter]|uniref:PAS domain-containing sensor histidine kinase n=1 Tax=unclassified Campylobacter TaxID=2593542 RepID=UPI001237C62E|nr:MULTISPECIES: PAS domain-containing sensor histidine kinase [unclassified Campylobacter]KAA6224596.1 PAS domain-containing sensor histidine kinase [Campylobacter sp. LR185c]KAA6224838.1 PAS domain-containing sensor histidine kinase [Campylobacter sp. LR286c]KAA6227985.1 PAS domain-containing sensor histidine kinase [Campylobacter sp. LR196d]KAA6233466.1 PAS domain-containing sensor histidine kinase [Campylobacter sp. LR291e]KAA8603541.1 ATPase [Campylobacter sp. LR185c]
MKRVQTQIFDSLKNNFIFVRLNEKDEFSFVSDDFCKISGYTQKELLGQKYHILKHPDIDKTFFDRLLKGQNTHHVIFKHIDKKGEVFYLDTKIIPIVDDKNILQERILISYDVSNSYKLSEELIIHHIRLRQMSMQLDNISKKHKKENDKLLANFNDSFTKALQKNDANHKEVFKRVLQTSLEKLVSDIAHQWRQPLNELGIAMFEMKQRVKDERGFSEIYLKSKDVIKSMSELIDNSRNFFNQHLEDNYTSLKQTLNEVLQILFEMLEKNNIKVICKFKQDFKVLAYKNDLLRVFANILLNSIEAFNLQKNKEISVNFTKFGLNYIKISIKDNAGGIEEENLDKIFFPYFSSKHPSQGVGVGLCICKQIVENLGGSIKARNVANGVCIEIFLKFIKDSYARF